MLNSTILGIDPGYAIIGFSVLKYYDNLISNDIEQILGNRKYKQIKDKSFFLKKTNFTDLNFKESDDCLNNIFINENFKIELISYGVITTSKRDNFFKRIEEIAQNIEFLFNKYKPDAVAIEKLFYFKNKKTIMQVSEVRGAIILLSMQNNIPVFEYTPLQIKMAITSYGRASKIQLQNMIKKIFNLDKIPEPDDAADAIACGLTHIWRKKNVLGN